MIMNPRKLLASTSIALLVLAGSASGASAATHAKPKPKAYKTCVALNKVYKHGVARMGAHDKVKGVSKPVKTFVVDTRTYNLNKKRDRDGDGVACEKK